MVATQTAIQAKKFDIDWLKSWSLWFNIFCGTVETLQYFIGVSYIKTPLAVGIVTWGNIIIRILKTQGPISIMGSVPSNSFNLQQLIGSKK
jgi:hypothetical protein